MSNGQRNEIQNNVFQIPNKSRITQRDSRKDTGHSLDLGMKRNGMELSQLYFCWKMGFHCHRDGEGIRGTGSSSISRASVLLSREGVLKRKNNRDTMHFTADASNTELLYRTIHSANQLSICGAVACWCQELGLKPDETSERLTK